MRRFRAARLMNIHEYQAKILFDQFSVPSPRGMVTGTSEEAAAAAAGLARTTMRTRPAIARRRCCSSCFA